MKTKIAKDGFYWTNGETYGKTLVLPDGADETIWREVREEDLPKEEVNSLEID